jgi:hypothetical protein
MGYSKKWEYKIETVGVTFGNWQIDKINKIGEEGWEAVGVFFGSEKSQLYILLKREKGGLMLVPSPSPPSPQSTAAPMCPTCGQPLTFVQQYGRWYCYNCKKYP